MNLNDPKAHSRSPRSPRDGDKRSTDKKSKTRSPASPIHSVQVRQNEIELKQPKLVNNFKQFVLTPINTQLVGGNLGEPMDQDCMMIRPPTYKLDLEGSYEQQVTHNIHAKIEALSPSKKSYMDQTELLVTPTIGGKAYKEFDKFRLIVNNGGGSPYKTRIRMAQQSPTKHGKEPIVNLLPTKQSEDRLPSDHQTALLRPNNDLYDTSVLK